MISGQFAGSKWTGSGLYRFADNGRFVTAGQGRGVYCFPEGDDQCEATMTNGSIECDKSYFDKLAGTSELKVKRVDS